MSSSTQHRRLFALVTLAAALLVTLVLGARALALPQPNLEVALAHLEQAKAALEHEERDKGGLRTRALESTNQAIALVRQGIQQR